MVETDRGAATSSEKLVDESVGDRTLKSPDRSS
jgi:hypothetical protein